MTTPKEPTDADNTVSAIDLLLSLDPLSYTEQDIDTIIALNRRHRQNLEGGIKPTRKSAKATAQRGEGVPDLASLIMDAVPAAPPISRRKLV